MPQDSLRCDVVAPTGDGYATAGTLWFRGGRATFKYVDSWLAGPSSYDITPALPRSSAPFFFHGLGPFSDAAPDRWGRKLLDRAAGRARLAEHEYLLGVSDVTRQGALRFLVDGVPQSPDSDIPALTDLPGLIDTADAVDGNREVPDASLRRLYRATGSLGGARPKASVFDNGVLWMAKFPKPDGDDWDVIGWEAVTISVARECGIDVPRHRTVQITDEHGRHRTVLLTQRFDRTPADSPDAMGRIPYVSALTALGVTDGEGGDWLDMAEFAREHGIATVPLWQRAVFGAAVGDCDDHLRNHGFLMDVKSRQWSLAPMFDMNPTPVLAGADTNNTSNGSADVHELALMGRTELDVAAFLEPDTLELFGITQPQAHAWCRAAATALPRAPFHARQVGIDARSLALIAARFTRGAKELAQAGGA